MSKKLAPQNPPRNAVDPWEQIQAQIAEASQVGYALAPDGSVIEGPARITYEQAARMHRVLAELRKALEDGDHPAWYEIVDPAWNRMKGVDTQDRRVAKCMQAMKRYHDMCLRTGGPSMVLLASMLRQELAVYDRAFDALDRGQVARWLPPWIDGRRGTVNMLARLTLACGALGAPLTSKPKQDDVEREANRLQRARTSVREKSSLTST